MQRQVGILAATAVTLAAAELFNGSVTRGYRHLKRSLSLFFAEHQHVPSCLLVDKTVCGFAEQEDGYCTSVPHACLSTTAPSP